jgi:hypothetical protein
MGHGVCQPHMQVMRLRRAALKIPAKSSVPPRSLLYKLSPLPTPSESTLPQLLIPLHFKSFISNTYKKPGGGTPKVCQLVTTPSPRHICASLHLYLVTSLHHFLTFRYTHSSTRNPFTVDHLFTTLVTPGGWGIPAEDSLGFSARLCDLCASALSFSALCCQSLLTIPYSLPTHRATVLKNG